MTAVFLNVTTLFRDLFADRGGPIVLGQVENELHTSDQAYIDYCGALTVQSGVDIMWGVSSIRHLAWGRAHSPRACARGSPPHFPPRTAVQHSAPPHL